MVSVHLGWAPAHYFKSRKSELTLIFWQAFSSTVRAWCRGERHLPPSSFLTARVITPCLPSLLCSNFIVALRSPLFTSINFVLVVCIFLKNQNSPLSTLFFRFQCFPHRFPLPNQVSIFLHPFILLLPFPIGTKCVL